MNPHHFGPPMQHTAFFRQRPTAAACLALVLAAAAPLAPRAVSAQPAAEAPRALKIAPGPLGAALNRFAAALGVELSVDAALLDGLRCNGLDGRYGAEDGFAALLAGHALQAVRQPNGSWTVQRRPQAAADSLPAITARAAGESATGPLAGYAARRSATATKTDTPMLETPQTLTVVGAEEIEVRKSDSLAEAVGYTASVLRSEGVDRTGDGFVMRGFQATASQGNLYRDGSKYSVNLYDGRQEPYGLERIEILKGAASVLYGNSAPGGIINTVSKRPTNEALHELNLELGSFDRRQLSGDFGGALDDAGVWSYRLTALVRDSGSFVEHVDDDRRYFAPSLRWQPDAATSLTLQADLQDDHTAYVYGLPAEGTVLANPNGRLPRDTFVGEPGYDRYDLDRRSLGYLFEHRFDEHFTLRHSLRSYRADVDMPSVWISGLEADGRTTAYRGAQDREDRSRALMSDTSLQSTWRSGSVEHTALVGLDFVRERLRTVRYDRSAEPLDLYDPVYGGGFGAPEPASFSSRSELRRVGLYAQERAKIDGRWVAVAGLRHDRVRYDESAVFSDDVAADGEKSSATTGRAGLVYLGPDGLAPFVSFSQSFEPQTGTDRQRQRFDPTRGTQWELGLRWQPEGGQTLLSAALYQLTQRKVLVTDPVDTNYSVQLGEVRSRGLELEARTRVGAANLVAAYAYTDARTLKSSPLTPEAEGRRTGAVPYHQASVWADYGFGAFGLPALKAGAGLRYVGSAPGVWLDVDVPGYTVVDAMLSWSEGPWRLALNVANLGDKTYVASCTYLCFYGEPRRVTGSVSYRW
ncbi:ferrichrome-iron receptor FhuA [Rubrivivax gelatinosus IL144]|uniref:Ferrichrome-iron receptor FhuA n=2 Tax=Rubrivivax gelatinosus TaxID=28068 RepID=I0HTQ6_RUBGI|nr:ferrichrome-iron receptor FhuA [Rubrivivax gelatinosus IL144]